MYILFLLFYENRLDSAFFKGGLFSTEGSPFSPSLALFVKGRVEKLQFLQCKSLVFCTFQAPFPRCRCLASQRPFGTINVAFSSNAPYTAKICNTLQNFQRLDVHSTNVTLCASLDKPKTSPENRLPSKPYVSPCFDLTYLSM